MRRLQAEVPASELPSTASELEKMAMSKYSYYLCAKCNVSRS